MVLIGLFSPSTRIEPDYIPTTTAKYPTSGQTNTPRTPNTSNQSSSSTSNAPTMASLIPKVNFTTDNTPDLIRKIACLAAFALHVPINILWVMAHGFTLFIILWVLLSCLNLLCVAWGLARLDAMRGERALWKIWTRRDLDYIIIGILVTYFVICTLFVVGWVDRRYLVWLVGLWPWLIISDLMCFVSGWLCATADVSPPYLG